MGKIHKRSKSKCLRCKTHWIFGGINGRLHIVGKQIRVFEGK
jgi:hypothetical protein